MRIVTLDFETYYDQDYSLSKMTTEEYVRNPRFEAIMVGVKVDAGKTYTVVGGDISYALRELELHKNACLTHHSQFDCFILSHHYGICPKIIFDTIPMARAHVGSVAAKGMSLGALRQHFGMADKGIEVVLAKGKHLTDFTVEELREYRRYCGEDVDGTYAIFQRLIPHFSLGELKLIDLTTRLFTEPLLEFDVPLLEEYKAGVVAQKAYLLLKAGVLREDLTSNQKFAEVLRRMGVEPPTKKSPTTGKQTFAFAKTDKGMLELLEHADPAVVAVAEARVGVKTSIAETRAQRFIEMGPRGAVPIYLKYWGAEQTGRHSAADKGNFLNLGRNQPLDAEWLTISQVVMTPRGRADVREYSGGKTVLTSLGEFPLKNCHKIGLRDTLRAPSGYRVVVGDSSNIEARMVCYLAGQQDVLQTYRDGGDPYCDMASYIFGEPVVPGDSRRTLGKVVVLGCGFGMGVNKFYDTANKPPWSLGIDMPLASAGVLGFRGKYNKVKELWDYCGRVVIPAMASGKRIYADRSSLIVTDRNALELPSGRMLRYPNLRQEVVKEKDDEGNIIREDLQWVFDVREGSRVLQKKLYGGLLTENMTQAMARIVVMDQIVAVSKRHRVVLPVYDEAVCCVPEGQAEACEVYVNQCLSTPPSWAPDLPVACGMGSGEFYGAAK